MHLRNVKPTYVLFVCTVTICSAKSHKILTFFFDTINKLIVFVLFVFSVQMLYDIMTIL